jgi:hypothetical protein
MDNSDTPVTCVHLAAMEVAARQAGVPIEQIGDWWSNGHTQNVYFACVLDEQKLRDAFTPPPHVEWIAWDGRTSGHEAGFYCNACNASLVGAHPLYAEVYRGRIWPQ